MRPVSIVGAAALSAYGAGWRGLGGALAAGEQLAGIPDDDALAAAPDARGRALARARKMMSRGAYLAAKSLGELVREVEWTPSTCEAAGYFLGVGASGGSLDDVTALLDASITGEAFSLERFGEQGLGACNPLLAFQLMNNFTMCHGAILEGLGGPNSAFFSRGAGTTAALIEAVHAIRIEDCEHAVAGGADSAKHPVTRAELSRAELSRAELSGAELSRESFVARGMRPSEGAGLVALAAGSTGFATVEGCAIASGHGRPLIDAIGEAVAAASIADVALAVDLVVVAPWGPPAADALRTWAQTRVPKALLLDVSVGLGDPLAATHALAWIAALDLLVARRASRALVVGAGTDGDIGAVVLAGGDA